MLDIIILVFVGGAAGAMLRELLMLMIPQIEGFPLDILVANLVAAFLLGLVTALHRRNIISGDVNTMAGTGIMGGLSTFSSMAYSSVVLLGLGNTHDITTAIIYLLASVILGYIVVIIGLKLGGGERAQTPPAVSVPPRTGGS